MLQPQILSLFPASNTFLADSSNSLNPLDVINAKKQLALEAIGF
jgi:hypothetical protein